MINRKVTYDELTFRPIDFANHSSTAVAFRRDSYVISFGDDRLFLGEDGQGPQRYLELIKIRSTELPGSIVQVFFGDEIIGQIEARIGSHPGCGYLNLIYLNERWRGFGIGQLLDRYVETLASTAPSATRHADWLKELAPEPPKT